MEFVCGANKTTFAEIVGGARAARLVLRPYFFPKAVDVVRKHKRYRSRCKLTGHASCYHRLIAQNRVLLECCSSGLRRLPPVQDHDPGLRRRQEITCPAARPVTGASHVRTKVLDNETRRRAIYCAYINFLAKTSHACVCTPLSLSVKDTSSNA